MLASFTIFRQFNKLRATLVVDCVHKDARLTIVYDRRIRAMRDIPLHEVATPEMAEKWLSRESVSYPEHGNMLEALEAQYRLAFGIGAPSASLVEEG